MSQIVIATIQPSMPHKDISPHATLNSALAMLREAAVGSDIVALPEYMNGMNMDRNPFQPFETKIADNLIEQVSSIASENSCYIILPMVIEVGNHRFNRAILFDREGRQVGHFDKVHVTEVERNSMDIQSGHTWPVFDCDFGRIGIMICYDGCFCESARILALKGARIIFWPSLQRGYTETELDLQTRSHAYFNHCIVVRSSYGTDANASWTPGMMVGLSCICADDGIMIASLGKRTGWTSAKVDLNHRMHGQRSFNGEAGCLREMQRADRQPQTYHSLVEAVVPDVMSDSSRSQTLNV